MAAMAEKPGLNSFCSVFCSRFLESFTENVWFSTNGGMCAFGWGSVGRKGSRPVGRSVGRLDGWLVGRLKEDLVV